MNACKRCGSFAINPTHHGRDGSDNDLCDVCYWRKRATPPADAALDDVGHNLTQQDVDDISRVLRWLEDNPTYPAVSIQRVIERNAELRGIIDALRARQPAQAAAVPEVWIAHDGGKCPLPAGVLVETRWRNGREFAAEACRPDGEAWSWPPSSTDADNIVAYRLAASKGGAT